MTLAVISPHLDDAAASLGQALTARDGPIVVITVFAGIPSAQPNTAHDARSGFATGAEAMKTRRSEDDAALAELRVDGTIRLDFLDGQYTGGLDRGLIPDEIIAAIRTIHDSDGIEVAAPLGLSHPDHIDTARALPRILDVLDVKRLFFYADLPYAELWPHLIDPALEDLAGLGLDVIDADWPAGPIERKAEALAFYASQARALHMPTPLVAERIYEASAT